MHFLQDYIKYLALSSVFNCVEVPAFPIGHYNLPIYLEMLIRLNSLAALDIPNQIDMQKIYAY